MGQSLNLYVAEPSGRKLSAMYKDAWRLGLKTTYYLRSLAALGIGRDLAVEGTRQNERDAGGHGEVVDVLGVGDPVVTDADAVVDVRMETSSVSQGASEVIAYGTADRLD